MNRVGGDLADDDTDVVAVSKLRRETRPRHFMQHALLPHGFLEVVLHRVALHCVPCCGGGGDDGAAGGGDDRAGDDGECDEPRGW